MDEQRIETVLRAGPPDEPVYQGDVASTLTDRLSRVADTEPPTAVMLHVSELTTRRRAWGLVPTVAAAVLVVIGLIAVTREREPSLVAPPDKLAQALIDRWVGAPLNGATSAAFVDIASDVVVYRPGKADSPGAWDSEWSAETSDVIRLVMSAPGGGCNEGAVGRYRWALSASGATLTLTAIADECASRAQTLTGQWTHTACKLPTSDCLGPVDPGGQASVSFDPFDTFTYGELAYALPSGWAVSADTQSNLFLRHANDYADLSEDGSGGTQGIDVWADVAAVASDCSTQPDPASGTSSAEIAAQLATNPGLISSRTIATVGARHAEVVDVEVAPDQAQTCTSSGTAPSVGLLTSRTGVPAAWRASLRLGERARVLLVDLDQGRTVAVIIHDQSTPSRFDELLAEATPIVESFAFSPTPPTR
jgi:hypothetical protein